MSWKEDFIRLMQQAPPGAKPQLATMTGKNTCKVGNMELEAADMLINDRLKSTAYVKDEALYINMQDELKAGDTVCIYQVSDSQFLVLGRMVET